MGETSFAFHGRAFGGTTLHSSRRTGHSSAGSSWKAKCVLFLCSLGVLVVSGSALAEQPALLGDLEAMHPNKLSKQQLEQLLPGAKMSRKVYSGSTNYWTNEPDGTLVVSTDNRGRIGTSAMAVPSTSPGRWHISPEGRYCVTIEWKKIATEDWCRYVFETSEGYYSSKSDQNRSEKVYRLEINGR